MTYKDVCLQLFTKKVKNKEKSLSIIFLSLLHYIQTYSKVLH